MKSPAYSKLKLLTGVGLLCLALAALTYFIALPFLLPAPGESTAEAMEELGLSLAAVVFLACLIAVSIALLACSIRSSSEKTFQVVADAMRQPFLVLDGEGRYLLLNREAEKILGVSRERDIGKNADYRIIGALAGVKTDGEERGGKLLLDINQRHFQIFDSQLTDKVGMQVETQRLVLLFDVESHIRLYEAVRDINQAMNVLNTNASKISATSTSLSQGATEQAASLLAITSTMGEFSKKVQSNSESSAKSTQLAAQAREAAERSGKEIANALSAMTDVQDAGIRIARIVKLIDDIAFQTNLLALNAAVEAARAGRQGKGFAVVADEVRNLAGRSAKAAKDTASMVEDVTERIGNATSFMSKLEEMLRNIVQDAIRMADSSASSSSTFSEQTAGILHVNQELGQMNNVTHSTMSAAEQTATAVSALAHQVELLKGKLESLDRDFPSRSDAPDKREPTRSINLLDDPDTASEQSFFRPYSEQEAPSSYSDLSRYAPDTARSDLARDWDLNAEMQKPDDSPLSSLLNSDGYAQDYKSFLDARTRGIDPFDMKFERKARDTQEARTPDGDRVVKPNQNIVLDDSEFGRY